MPRMAFVLSTNEGMLRAANHCSRCSSCRNRAPRQYRVAASARRDRIATPRIVLARAPRYDCATLYFPRPPGKVPPDVGSTAILDLMGGVALLLWGLHMVHSGVVRAFGAELRRLLGIALHNRFRAFFAGALVTALLQSSTATGLMTASFVTAGTLDLAPALAVMLGANVGTTLVVQILSFNITLVTPVLLCVGLVAFKRSGRTRTRDLGRVAIGAGLMLLALHILLGALGPAQSSPAARALLGAITGQPVLCLVVAAVLTWAAHSSVAVILLVMSLATAHFVSPVAVLALVLGANLGSAINPLIEASQPGNPASRRLPIGNLLTRVAGCLAVLPFLQFITDMLLRLEPNTARLAADFHTAFNVVLAVAFIAPLPGLAAL